MLLTSSIHLDALILAAVTFFAIYKYYSRAYSYWKRKGVPYLTPIPFFGNFKDIALLRKSIGVWLKECYDKIDAPYFGIYVFDKPCIVIKSPELIRDVLIKDFDHFFDRTTPMPKHEEIQQGMMLLQKGKEWKETREKFTAMFTSGKFRQLSPTINTYAEKVVKLIRSKGDGNKVDVSDFAIRYVTDILCRSFVGIEAYCLEEDSEILSTIKRAMSPSHGGGISSMAYFFRIQWMIDMFKLNFPSKEGVDYFGGIFQHLIQVSKETGGRISNLIDIVNNLKNNESFRKKFTYGNKKAAGQPFMFFIAGQNTLTTSLTFTLYELAINPEVQRKLRDEVIEARGEDGCFTYEKIVGMKYMEMVVQEMLRKYPPLSFLDRECMKDYTIRGTDVVIPKGQQVYIAMLGSHYDEKIFPEPEKFIPERLESKAAYNQGGFRLFPFGEGPRICIGERFALMNLKIAIAHVVSNFEVEPADDTPQKIQFTPLSFILMSEDPINLVFKPLSGY